MSHQPGEIAGVTISLKANVYFEGGVVSHTLTAPGAPRRTLGIIRPGSYTFNTGDPERMDILAGSCRVKLAGAADWTRYAAGSFFLVPASSRFEIAVDDGFAEYLCTFG